MRNLKKLLAVVVAICVLATFTVPAFAADAKTDAQICTDLGVLKGTGGGVTADYLKTTPDRLQGAIMFLRLKGLEDTAKAFLGTDNFADVDGLNDTNQAILAYLKANPDLGFEGVGDDKFAPTEKMTAKQYYKVMLVALGYTYNTDFTWANVFTFAAGKGILKLIDNETFTVNDLSIATVEALKVPAKGGTDTLIAKLVAGGSITSAAATASGLYVAVPATLTVVSATADTLKTAKIVFNQEIDSATVVKANFSNSDVTTDPKLLADKKTVLVVFDTTKTQSKTEDIVIENVKSASGTKITKVTQKVTFVDTTIPVISGALAKNAKSIVISASEPINFAYTYPIIMGDIKLDGASTIASSSVDFAANTVTLNLSTALTSGTHKLEISGLKDYANYTAVATTYNIDVAADTTAPSVSSAKVNNLREVEVTFSEDVDPLALGSFWVNGTQITSGNIAQQSNKAVFKLTLTSDLDIGATVEVKVEYQDQKDVIGNKVSSKTAFTFKVADDTTLPTVTATLGSDNKLTLTFSKSMLTSAGTIKIQKASDKSQIYSTGTVTAGLFKTDTNNTVIELAASTTGLNNEDPRDIIVNVKDMKDGTVRKNALAEANIALKTNDTKKPTIADSYVVTAGSTMASDYVTFYFSEAMDSATLNNLSNYVLTSGSAIPLSSYTDAKVKEVASDNKSIKITVPNISDNRGQTFMVYAIKDVAGNMMITPGAPIAKLAGDTFVISVAAGFAPVATAQNKVEVYFDDMVSSFDPSAFAIKEFSGATSATAFVIGYTIDNTKVALTLNRDIGTSPSGLYFGVMDASKVKNVYGTSVTAIADRLLVDKVDPTVSVDTAAVTTGAIVVTFSENVSVFDVPTLLTDLVVRKADDSLVTLTNGSIKFLNGDGGEYAIAVGATPAAFKAIEICNLESVKDYSVELLPRNIKDLAGNTTSALAKTTKTTK